MQAPHRYPVGIQSFEKIRTQGYLYVDKTEYIWNLIQAGGDYRFLSRPRRFGKTLLVATLEAYFQGRRELFEGLAMEKLDGRDEWPKHPVLRFDLSQFKASDEGILMQKFDAMLSSLEERYGISNLELAPGVRLDALIRAAHASAGGDAGVVVLIDEYDAPLLNVVHDPDRLQRFREVMREFYSPLKANEDNIAFLFITGISKFSQLSIFSELNNLNNVSMLPQYAGICGITSDEIDSQLGPDVAYLAERMGVEPAECRERLREMYDGYRFSKRSPGVYNPFSLVTALSNAEIDSYWFGSGTPTSLVNLLRANDVEIPELEGVRAPASAFDAPAEAMDDPIAFMYQSGYLTIKGYDGLLDAYTLGIPNKEVADGLYKSLLPVYVKKPATETGSFLADFTEAIARNSDMDAALHFLRSFLAGIPYDMAPKDEKSFQTILYLMLRLVGANIQTEVRTATGRIDAVIDAPGALYVMELKYRHAGEEHPNSADALAQIDDKGYLIPWEAGSKPVAKVGIAYSEEARTIDDDWAIEKP